MNISFTEHLQDIAYRFLTSSFSFFKSWKFRFVDFSDLDSNHFTTVDGGNFKIFAKNLIR